MKLDACIASLRSLAVPVALVFLMGCASDTSAQQGQETCQPIEGVVQKILDADAAGVQAAVGFLHCYDAGELEDLYRALGVSFTKNPMQVMRFARQSQLEKPQFVSLFTMLPLSYVDDPCGSAAEMERRMLLVSSLEGFEAEKQMAIEAIDRSLQREHKQCCKEQGK